MLRNPSGLPPRQLPSWTFPWKATTAILKWEQPDTTQEKDRKIWMSGGFTIQPLNKRDNRQLKFSLLNILLKWFPELTRIWILCFVLFIVQILFTVKSSPCVPSFSITLRNPSSYCKKKIMLQDILQRTDMLLVRRCFCGGRVLGSSLSEISQTAKGYLFADHRPAVPWLERLGG